jgi:hypothetical protein
MLKILAIFTLSRTFQLKIKIFEMSVNILKIKDQCLASLTSKETPLR